MIEYKEKDETEWIEMRYAPSTSRYHLKIFATRWNIDVRQVKNGETVWEYYSSPWHHEQIYDPFDS